MDNSGSDPTAWIETFDFTGDTLPEGWEILHGHYEPGKGISSVTIYKEELEKRPDIKELLSQLKARFWNRGIMTFFDIRKW